MASLVSGGTAERITARMVFKVVRAGSGTAARYSSTFFAVALRFMDEARWLDLAFFIQVSPIRCLRPTLHCILHLSELMAGLLLSRLLALAAMPAARPGDRFFGPPGWSLIALHAGAAYRYESWPER